MRTIVHEYAIQCFPGGSPSAQIHTPGAGLLPAIQTALCYEEARIGRNGEQRTDQPRDGHAEYDAHGHGFADDEAGTHGEHDARSAVHGVDAKDEDDCTLSVNKCRGNTARRLTMRGDRLQIASDVLPQEESVAYNEGVR